MKILVVDDKPENLYLLRALLTGHGHEVDEARHGAEALVKARHDPPAIIISDLLMPVMDGYTLLRHWKADPRLKHVPFIVYTATYTDAKDEQLALEMGADAFLLKPAEPDLFMARIQEVLANAARGALASPHAPVGEEKVLLKEYSETLVRKLEEKALQLEQANRALQAELTERQQIEATLRASEERLRAIIDTEPECVKLLAADGSLLEMNPAGLRMIEADSFQQVENHCLYPLVVEEHRAAFKSLNEKVFAGESGTLKFEVVGLQGGRRWLETHASPLRDDSGNVTALLGITRDITARRQAEEERDRIFDLSLDLLCVGGFDGYFKQVNPAWTSTLGWSTAELLSRPWLDLVHPEDREATVNAKAELVEGRNVIQFENRYRHQDGSYRWLSWSAFPLLQAEEIFAVARDITERKQAEAVLRQSEQRLRLVLDGLGPQMFVGLLDLAGVVLMANRPALEAAGLRLEDVLGKRVHETYWLSYSDAVAERLRAAVQRGAQGEATSYDEQIRFAEGQLVWVTVSIRPLWDEAGKLVFVVPSAIVIHERKLAEAESRTLTRRLLVAEDWERRRIARELHDSTAQDLVAANLNLSALRERLAAREESHALELDDSIALLERAASDVRTLAYVLHPPRLQDEGLAQALRHYVSGFGKRTGIAVTFRGDADVGRLPPDTEIVLFRVLQECLGNVHRHADSATVEVRLDRRDATTVLEVRDTGRGMAIASTPDSSRTQADVNGEIAPGVGLPGMRERLRQLGGRLELESSPHGTTVRAFLPDLVT